ncbi:hypothetical protein HYZ97_02890 [Candidatus Pacearchaeota archaeon]|nr:hypothetical protein [Candidatus Pacearchaeota archaeon]
MNRELVIGLKNALEHGATLDQAVASFINAGYNQQEVTEAANALAQGVIPIITSSPVKSVPSSLPVQKPKPATPQQLSLPAPRPSVPAPALNIQQASGFAAPPAPSLAITLPKKEGINTNLVVGLLAAFIFILALLILTIVFSDQIVAFFSS